MRVCREKIQASEEAADEEAEVDPVKAAACVVPLPAPAPVPVPLPVWCALPPEDTALFFLFFMF